MQDKGTQNMDDNIKSKYQIIAEEILSIMIGVLFKHTTDSSGSPGCTFYGNAMITSLFLYNNLFNKLSSNNFDISNEEYKVILVTLASHATQLFLAYQRAQENRWDEQPSLAETGFNLIAATAPAMITYFQQCRNARRDVPVTTQNSTPVNDNIENLVTNIRYKKDL